MLTTNIAAFLVNIMMVVIDDQDPIPGLENQPCARSLKNDTCRFFVCWEASPRSNKPAVLLQYILSEIKSAIDNNFHSLQSVFIILGP